MPTLSNEITNARDFWIKKLHDTAYQELKDINIQPATLEKIFLKKIETAAKMGSTYAILSVKISVNAFKTLNVNDVLHMEIIIRNFIKVWLIENHLQTNSQDPAFKVVNGMPDGKDYVISLNVELK